MRLRSACCIAPRTTRARLRVPGALPLLRKPETFGFMMRPVPRRRSHRDVHDLLVGQTALRSPLLRLVRDRFPRRSPRAARMSAPLSTSTTAAELPEPTSLVRRTTPRCLSRARPIRPRPIVDLRGLAMLDESHRASSRVRPRPAGPAPSTRLERHTFRQALPFHV